MASQRGVIRRVDPQRRHTLAATARAVLVGFGAVATAWTMLPLTGLVAGRVHPNPSLSKETTCVA